jgi:uncharacterized protein YecT (DUF1311 family)
MLLAAILAVAAASSPAVGQTQREINRESADRMHDADRQLDAVYRKLTEKISPAGQAALDKAQQSWRQFREQECDFETLGSAGGSIRPMALAECRARLTRERVAQLEAQLNCEEGDTSCGRQ